MLAEKKIKNLIFINTLSEALSFVHECKKGKFGNKTESVIVSMHLEARVFLNDEGFKVEDTLDYFDNDAHKNALEKSENIAEWIRKNIKINKFGLGIDKPCANWLNFWARFAIHYILYSIEIISNAVLKHRPEKIYVSLSEKISGRTLYIEPEEKYFGYLAKMIAESKGIKVEDIKTKKEDKEFKALLKAIIFALKYLRFKIWEVRTFFKKKKGLIFFTTVFYQMDKLKDKISSEMPDKASYVLGGPVTPEFRVPDFIISLFWRGHSKELIDQKQKFMEFGDKTKTEKDIFSYRGISFSDIMADKLKVFAGVHVFGLILWALKLNAFIDRHKPEAFISNGNRKDDLILAQIAKLKGIKSIFISHGSHVKPKNRPEEIEWGEHGRTFLNAPFSHLALQSPLAEGYLEVFPSNAEIVKTGPLIWGKQVKAKKDNDSLKKIFGNGFNVKDTKIILHAGTPKPTNSLRFHIYETPDEYIANICDLAEAIENVPNALLVVKFRPTKHISTRVLKSLVPFSDKVILNIADSFLDVLGAADLLASFSSTTIEEALQNKIPVLLYGCEGRYQHISAYSVRQGDKVEPSALYHVAKKDDLSSAIENILKLDIVRAEKEDIFKKYSYSESERQSIISLLKNIGLGVD